VMRSCGRPAILDWQNNRIVRFSVYNTAPGLKDICRIMEAGGAERWSWQPVDHEYFPLVPMPMESEPPPAALAATCGHLILQLLEIAQGQWQVTVSDSAAREILAAECRSWEIAGRCVAQRPVRAKAGREVAAGVLRPIPATLLRIVRAWRKLRKRRPGSGRAKCRK
jgi:hypothetical protein